MRLKKFLAGFTGSKGFISQRGSDDLQGINRLASENKPLRALKPRFDSLCTLNEIYGRGRAVKKSKPIDALNRAPKQIFVFHN